MTYDDWKANEPDPNEGEEPPMAGELRDDPDLWEEVPNEELRAGDMVDVLGVKRITRIRPYDGPHRAFIFALADTVPGVGFSLERVGYTRRLR